MNSPISQSLAARLASDAYSLVTAPTRRAALITLRKNYGNILEIVEDSLATATSGTPFILRTQTGFGMILQGRGALADQSCVIFRCTEVLGDLITDLSAFTTTSAGGRLVHDGFRRTLSNMHGRLRTLINMLENGSTIHCIGHSLGGGLATLAAE